MSGTSRLGAVLFAAAFVLAASGAAAQENPNPPPKPENPRSADNKAPGSGPNPYRDCGIGASLFSNTGWAAVTSNVIWDLGLTALTSATSSPQTCNGKQSKVAQFIADTYVSVVDETARGSGEHLTAMLELYECKVESHGDIVAAIRGEVGQGVAAPTYAAFTLNEKAEQYYLIVNRHIETDFTQSCAI